eukprot:gene11379-12709_t
MSISSLEQLIIQKDQGGGCVILSNAHHNHHWSYGIADYLLKKAYQASRFSKILFLSFDRQQEEIEEVLSSSVKESDKLKGTGNVKFITTLPTTLNSNTLHEEIFSFLTEDTTTPKAIFLYSLSEVSLCYDKVDVWRWCQSLLTHCQHHHTLLVTTLHSSLHNEKDRSMWTSLFPTVVKVSPNGGHLSEVIAGEVQVLRRSPTSGKVTEEQEMVQWVENCLQPIAVHKEKKSSRSGATGGRAEEGTKQEKQGEGLSESLDSKNENEANIARFITFDSTDPEFDEDSDPDADLDL